MFPKGDIKIPDNNIDAVIKGKIEDVNTSLDHGLSQIKREFEEEETTIQYGVLESKLEEKNVDGLEVFDGGFSESAQKMEPTINDRSSRKAVEIKSEITEKHDDFNTSLDYHWSNKKCAIYIDSTTDTGVNQYKCEICGKCYTQKGSLNVHIRTHTGKKPYKCEICGRCFNRSQTLHAHMRIHTREKPFKCVTCGKCFTEKANLNKHIKIHTGEKPHRCETCGKCFIVKETLYRHSKTHTGEKPYQCGTCGKCFAEKANLKNHIKIHTREKLSSNIKCEFEEEETKIQYGVLENQLHEEVFDKSKTHTAMSRMLEVQKSFLETELAISNTRSKENLYKCETCNKCFTTKGSLNTHMKIHTKEKPYKCKRCGRCFTVQDTLKSHIRTHTGEKPYKCETCGKCFGQRYSLHMHVRIHTR